MARLLRQTRPPVQRERIVGDIRRRIVAGEYPAGGRLPTHKELVRRYATGPVTVQDALDRLRSEGFIATQSRRGIYVASRPPHLSRYGMVFYERPVASQTYFFQALMDEAKRDHNRKIDFFYVADPFHHRDREEYQDLLETVLNDRVAGLVFTFNPFLLEPTPVLQRRGLPRVSLMEQNALPGLSSVYVDYAQWMARALDAVKARGCRRVAFLGTPHVSIPGFFEQGVRERGLTTDDLWVQAVPAPVQGATPWLPRVVQLMMAGPANRRPEALVISDDNQVEDATAGLVEAGLTPRDIYVVAHTNFPRPAPSALPVERLGFDVGAVLQTCWGLIDQQRQGKPMPATVRLVPPIFEHEFKPNAPLVALCGSSAD